MARQKRTTTGETSHKFVSIRLTPSEHQYFRDLAGSLSLSEFFRRAGLGQPIPQYRKAQPVPQVNREVLLELGRIGSNLNQISRSCHIALKQGQGCSVDPSVLEELRAQLKTLSWAIAGIDPGAPAEEDSEP
ncbi:MAG: plasmid mobilization relaxosome protein MobC [Synechococcales bacterium]|nr:plasmid mobilization relaxosome protein MobC [Synechococcales bacterium]